MSPVCGVFSGASTADEPNALSADAWWLGCFSLKAVSWSQNEGLSAWERAQGPVFQATDSEIARFSLVAQKLKNPCVCLVTQSCPTLCDPMNCSPPGFSAHGDSPGKNTGLSSLSLLQGIFLTQRSNPGLLHCRQILYHLVAQTVKNLPVVWETWVRCPGWEDFLEEGMATHSSIHAWRFLMDRGAWQATVHGITKSWTRLSD